MRFVPTRLEGAYVVEPEPHGDERGFFARSWDREEFGEHGLATEVVQCSFSRNTRVGTLRGLHFQTAPHEEVKLVQLHDGAIFDVVVDWPVEQVAGDLNRFLRRSSAMRNDAYSCGSRQAINSRGATADRHSMPAPTATD